jgi:hypothetical protein
VEESELNLNAEPAKGEFASTTVHSQVASASEQSTASVARTLEQPVSEREAMASVLEKLQEIGAVDPAAQQHLLAELRTAEPKHWSLMVEQFQTTMAFRLQLAARDSKQSNTLADQKQTALATSEDVNGVSTDQVRAASSESGRQNSQVILLDSPSAVSSLSSLQRGEPTGRISAVSRLANVSEPGTPAESGVQAVSYQPDKDHRPGGLPEHNVSQKIPAAKSDAWERVIALMEESVAEVPDSTDDIHQQMRLRLLYLIADRQEEALRSIPGATPAQQDYWSQQLFALSTFLDNQAQSDSKRRASAALLHLDEARGTLAQLATLDVRNLTFVESVDGYGAYQSARKTQFEPGQKVTLYAEVENYHSESTEQGNRVSLGTSYKIVDESGRRVDGGQFPDVLDQCKNHRRDFHIQYAIPLPKRVYPGSYQLQLIVTDNQTGKIGQASLPFKIAEETR